MRLLRWRLKLGSYSGKISGLLCQPLTYCTVCFSLNILYIICMHESELHNIGLQNNATSRKFRQYSWTWHGEMSACVRPAGRAMQTATCAADGMINKQNTNILLTREQINGLFVDNWYDAQRPAPPRHSCRSTIQTFNIAAKTSISSELWVKVRASDLRSMHRRRRV